MEEEINKNWKDILQVFQVSNRDPKDRIYLTKEDQEIFERKIRRALRDKKLQRIFNI